MSRCVLNTLEKHPEKAVRDIYRERYLNEPFDMVITVCDQAAEVCPIFPGAKQRKHWSFPDPSKATGSETEQLAVYRRVREEIREKIEKELVQS